MAGRNPVHQMLVAGSQNPANSPELRARYADQAAGMLDHAQALIKDAPPAPAPLDSLAQHISDLHDQASDHRESIASQQDAGKPAASEQQQLSDTVDQLHAATQSLQNRVSPDLQRQIAEAAAPGIDWKTAQEDAATSPATHFATAEIGSALRDQTLTPDQQRGIRALAQANGVAPDLALHIADHALGAKTLKDLRGVMRGDSIGQSKAQTLTDRGLLQSSDPSKPTAPLHVTSDSLPLQPPGIQKALALRPELFRFSDTSKTPADVLNKLAEGGQQRYVDTARRLLGDTGTSRESKGARPNETRPPNAHGPTDREPAPTRQDPLSEAPNLDRANSSGGIHDAVHAARDRIASNLAEPAHSIFQARLRGEAPNDFASRHNITPEAADKISDGVANHVARLMAERGIDADAARTSVGKSRDSQTEHALANASSSPAKPSAPDSAFPAQSTSFSENGIFDPSSAAIGVAEPSAASPSAEPPSDNSQESGPELPNLASNSLPDASTKQPAFDPGKDTDRSFPDQSTSSTGQKQANPDGARNTPNPRSSIDTPLESKDKDTSDALEGSSPSVGQYVHFTTSATMGSAERDIVNYYGKVTRGPVYDAILSFARAAGLKN